MMKKRIFIIILTIAMAAVLVGCASASDEAATEPVRGSAEADTEVTTGEEEAETGTDESANISAEDQADPEEEAPENSEPDEDSKADALGTDAEAVREIYLDFMRGNGTLTVPDFSDGEGDYYYAAIMPGEYTYPALKVAYETGDGHDTTTQYAFADLGGDGIEELVLCFENTEPSFMNWTGIIHCEDGQLELVHSYEDGYRTSSALYEEGFMEIGGSFGAGASGTDYLAFSGKGSAETLFTVNHFFSSFATQIAYDLEPVGTGYSGDESWGDENCELEITEYIPAERNGQGVKISVDNYSAAPARKAAEERFVKELVGMGAEEISSEEMNELTAHEGFSGPSVEWQDWEEVCTIVKATDFEYVYPKPEDYLEADVSESDYFQKVLITTNKPIKDVRVLELSVCDYSEEDGCIYSSEEIVRFEELTPDKPLVICMVFMGDTPNQGITYVDENGVEKTMAIAMSGMDGSIYLEEAKLR